MILKLNYISLLFLCSLLFSCNEVLSTGHKKYPCDNPGLLNQEYCEVKTSRTISDVEKVIRDSTLDSVSIPIGVASNGSFIYPSADVYIPGDSCAGSFQEQGYHVNTSDNKEGSALWVFYHEPRIDVEEGNVRSPLRCNIESVPLTFQTKRLSYELIEDDQGPQSGYIKKYVVTMGWKDNDYIRSGYIKFQVTEIQKTEYFVP